MGYKPDWADRLADATTRMRHKNRWEYERPVSAWERMPWFVRWPLAGVLAMYVLGGILAGINLIIFGATP